MMNFNEDAGENTKNECRNECVHIGDVELDENIVDDVEATITTTTVVPPPASATTMNKKKKWIAVIGSSVIAVSLAIAIGLIVTAKRSEKKTSTTSLATDRDPEWYACLTKESCFKQAKLLGYNEEDFRTGDYSYASAYGCFRENS